MTPRHTITLLLVLSGSAVHAQSVTLAEVPRPGECSRYALDMNLSGELVVTQGGQKQPIKLEARATLRFTERTLTTDAGLPLKSARHYDEADTVARIGADKVTHGVSSDRRLIVAQRTPNGPFCYSPAGPLTRDELDLVTEHFSPQCLPGLLPGKAVTAGDTWAVGNAATQTACQFDGLIRNALVGKLVGVKDRIATFTIEGTAEGIEHGARVVINVTSTGKFDLTAGRVTELAWKQKDAREQGPVNPASQVEATANVRREVLAREPAELSDLALAGASRAEVPPLLTHLRYTDAKGRFQFVYPREWHITGQTDAHLILRLLDRGEFIAQATVTAWKKLEPGKRVTADEFKKAISQTPGWAPARVLDDGELPTDGGRWVYRVTAEGKMDDVPTVQSFHLVVGPRGDHVAVTFAMRPEKVKALGTRDVSLVNAIEFGRK